jgi:hypothetical protein
MIWLIVLEKKPYLDRVIKLEAEYEKTMKIYKATEKEVCIFLVFLACFIIIPCLVYL